MKLFSICGAEVRISPFLLAAVPAAIALGGGRMLVVALLSLALHETAHAMAAHRLGYAVRALEIQPFGFVARLEIERASPGDAAAIFAAGPVASLAAAGISSLLEGLVPLYAEAKLGLTEYNLLLAAVNLLPALPLDGGRLLFAALSEIRAAGRILRALGILAGLLFIAAFALLLSRGALNVTFLVMGVFLAAAAICERDAVPAAKLVRPRPLKNGALCVCQLAMAEDTRLSSAFGMLPAGSYTMITVVDGSGGRVGELDEQRLMKAAMKLGASATLREAVAFCGRKMV